MDATIYKLLLWVLPVLLGLLSFIGALAAGTLGNGGTAASFTSNYYSTLGLTTNRAGVAGTAGGSHLGGAGGSITTPGMWTMGGTGGGGVSTVDTASGSFNITNGIIHPVISGVTGSVNGTDGFENRNGLWIFTSAIGGGGSNAGVGGNGGKGAIGCGGGGGGAGTTGGAGGRGGDGLVIIAWY